MYEEENHNTVYQAPRRSAPTNFFSIFAAVFAFIAIFMLMTGVLAVFFGSLALLFAILSKGRNTRMDATARLAAYASSFALIMGTALTGFAAYSMLKDDTSRARFSATVDALTESMQTGDTERYMEILREYYYEDPSPDSPQGGDEL